jgi:hypothetical protein
MGKAWWPLLLPLSAAAQAPEPAPAYRLVASLQRDTEYFTTDRLGNAYLAGPEGLIKTDSMGTVTGAFSDKSFGRIASVDATDPLKILLFNREFRRMVILDDRLAVQARIDLSDLGVGQPQLVCRSRHDGYWVYDAQTRRLLRFDTGLNRVTEGEILTYRLPRLDPDYMVESSDWLYLNDPENGILVADRYGTYYKTLRGIDAPHFQCDGASLLFAQGGRFVRLDPLTLAREERSLPAVAGLRQARIERNRLYVAGDGFFHIYSF